ncbi:MAG: hypothetical protein EBZ49_11040 [Proteobacteria bacterium]|nr:hypothetical protein [Pseudomonadota bacterium]
MPRSKIQATSKEGLAYSYVNRKGHTYHIHQGVTKTGKPKYFVSRNEKNALAKVPPGFEVNEDVNAVVFVQKITPKIISDLDVEVVRKQVASCKHLVHYQVQTKRDQIIIYEPIGLDALNDLVKSGVFSIIDFLKPYAEKLGGIDAILERTAKQAGVEKETLLKIDAEAAAEKKRKARETFLQNVQFDAVMRFTFDKRTNSFGCERRYYSGEGGWIILSAGKLADLASHYISHIGKESFFELM